VRDERELVVLLSAGVARRAKAATRIELLLETTDQDRLLTVLDRLQLTSLVGDRAVRLVGARRLPIIAAGAAAAAAATRPHAQRLAIIQRAVLRRLRAAGIVAAPLKGPDLAERIHGDLGLRPSADVDVLVDPDRLDDAVAAVRELGYGPPPPAHAPWLRELHLRLDHPAATMPPVEIHWRAEWYAVRGAPGGLARAALARSVADCAGVGHRLQPEDELALLLLVFARDGLVGLRLAADIAAWWDRYGAAIAPGAMQRIVDSDPALAAPLATAALSCALLVGLPAADLLDLEPARRLRTRLAGRLADPLVELPARRRAATLVDGLLSSRHTLRPYLRRRLLPPAGHIAVTYGQRAAAGNRVGVRLLQAQHPLRQIAGFAFCVAAPPRRVPNLGEPPRLP
jgi:hypothetical protein